ncbi:hypothetical protein QBC43DRAFT_17960 [Cladorrhinum sp. PSN259]|nr:hypothetical protein QBC43DRAFT_17960 [Cladorrhinum sp. PSN259]
MTRPTLDTTRIAHLLHRVQPALSAAQVLPWLPCAALRCILSVSPTCRCDCFSPFGFLSRRPVLPVGSAVVCACVWTSGQLARESVWCNNPLLIPCDSFSLFVLFIYFRVGVTVIIVYYFQVFDLGGIVVVFVVVDCFGFPVFVILTVDNVQSHLSPPRRPPTASTATTAAASIATTTRYCNCLFTNQIRN